MINSLDVQCEAANFNNTLSWFVFIWYVITLDLLCDDLAAQSATNLKVVGSILTQVIIFLFPRVGSFPRLGPTLRQI